MHMFQLSAHFEVELRAKYALSFLQYVCEIYIHYTDLDTYSIEVAALMGSIEKVCYHILPHRQIKYPVDFDDESKIGDVRYDNLTY